jgi:hypothetical protein
MFSSRDKMSSFGDKPGETVVVSFVGNDYPTTVGADGKWEVQMNCCDMLEDKVLTVKGESNTLTYTNVACGQVFVCSGCAMFFFLPVTLVPRRASLRREGCVGKKHLGGGWAGLQHCTSTNSHPHILSSLTFTNVNWVPPTTSPPNQAKQHAASLELRLQRHRRDRRFQSTELAVGAPRILALASWH